MKKQVKIYDPIFFAEFLIQVGGTKQEAFKWFAKETESDEEKIDETIVSRGSFFDTDSWKGGLIWVAETRESSAFLCVLTHELNHAVQHVLGKMGIQLVQETSEVYCYYSGWLMQRITEELDMSINFN